MSERRGQTPYADKFVENFIRLRAFRQISLQEISDRTGISKSYLSELQSAASGLSLEYACRIADALGEPLVIMLTTQAQARNAAPTTPHPSTEPRGNPPA